MLLLIALACSSSTPDPKPEPVATEKPSVRERTKAKTRSKSKGVGSKAGSDRAKATQSGGALGVTPVSEADKSVGIIERCAGERLAFGFWQGEYPEPIVQLDGPISVTVTERACGGPARACTVPAGLLHPWAKADAIPGARFATLTTPTTFEVVEAHELAGKPVAVGDQIKVLSYLSEGLCLLQAAGPAFEAGCPDGRTKQVGESTANLQVAQVPCDGAAPGWVKVDPALMSTAGVRTGEMVGFGEVKKAE